MHGYFDLIQHQGKTLRVVAMAHKLTPSTLIVIFRRYREVGRLRLVPAPCHARLSDDQLWSLAVEQLGARGMFKRALAAKGRLLTVDLD